MKHQKATLGLRVALIVTSAQVGTAIELRAQVKTVPDRVTCTSCSIELDYRLSFNEANATGNLTGTPSQVVQWRDEQRILRLVGRRPLVFAKDGRFLREIGRRGAGPGEFETVADLDPLPGDSLLILDSSLLRVSIFDPDLKFVRSVSLPFHINAIAVLEWPRTVAVNGVSYTSDQVGWPLHFMDFSNSPAKRQSSFGDNSAQLAAGDDYTLIRRFFSPSGKSFWAHSVTKYQLTRYSDDGRIELSIRRQPNWFANESPWSYGRPTVAPPPMLRAAAIRNDTLWVGLSIPRPDWQKAWRGVPVGRAELTAAERPDLSELWKTRIEVIDLRSHTLLAQRDIDGMLIDIDHRLWATLYDLTTDLAPRLQVFELRLRR